MEGLSRGDAVRRRSVTPGQIGEREDREADSHVIIPRRNPGGGFGGIEIGRLSGCSDVRMTPMHKTANVPM